MHSAARASVPQVRVVVWYASSPGTQVNRSTGGEANTTPPWESSATTSVNVFSVMRFPASTRDHE
jgi:hypothetical protein